MLPSILLVALFIGALITVHEFGHLIAAKRSGITVQVFSIGFGRPLLKKTWGGTEYRLSMIPLGGYIKMAGEDEPAAGTVPESAGPALPPGTGFADKPLLVKTAVIAAGPVANLILGFLLLSLMFGLYGIRYIAPVVDPAPGSAAELAGLKSGDLVLAVDDDTVRTFEQLEHRIAAAAGEDLHLVVRRDQARLHITLPIPADTWYTRERLLPVIADVAPESPAQDAGLAPGDSIISADGHPVASWYDIVEAARRSPGRPVELAWQRGESLLTGSITPAAIYEPQTGDTIGRLGISARRQARDIEPCLPPVIGQVRSRSPAARAGMQAGDTIIAVEGNPVRRWDEFLERVNTRPGDTLVIAWQRNGQTRTERVPVATERDQLTGQPVGQVGIWVEMARERLPVYVAVWEAVRRTGYVVVQTFVIIWQVITRQIPTRAVGGPVFVAKIAYEGASWGAEYLFALWALLSINLFVVNLLPIPVLDGGRIMLFGIEGLRRRKLSERELRWAMNLGWGLILLIFILVLFNDMLRLLGN